MIYIKLILTMLLWAGTFIAGKYIPASFNPFTISFVRYVIATFCLMAILVKKEKRPTLNIHNILHFTLLGLTGVFAYSAAFFGALQYIEASRITLIIATSPIFILLGSALFFKQSIRPIQLMGILLSVTGAIIVLSKGKVQVILSSGLGKGELLALVCALSWTAYTLIGKKVMHHYSPLTAITYSSLFGAILLLPPALQKGLMTDIQMYSVKTWLSLIYLGLIGTALGYVWFYEGVKRIGPAKAGLFINFIPPFTIVLAWILLKEPMPLSLFIGAVLIISGVLLTNRK
jgi:drug/metabolite transporter (DMT)-like permease